MDSWGKRGRSVLARYGSAALDGPGQYWQDLAWPGHTIATTSFLNVYKIVGEKCDIGVSISKWMRRGSILRIRGWI